MSNINSISSVDIAVSGLQAQAARMNVIANNIANAQTTDKGDGTAFRRLELALSAGEGELGGVEIGDPIADTTTPLQRVMMAGHPDADKDGYVTMPNVSVPVEMMSMVSATRAYQASAAVLKRFQDISNTTLELLR
ncbi:MAG: flagellar basal body rod protein FlgC [Planctomycetota bacterium]|nr:MAG: flagellar basal body rod protein FlgC [Planctomycetota bacterium]